VIQRDVVVDGLGLQQQSADAVTCFGSIEHWHSSPKSVLHSAVRGLRPRGSLILSAPNCVDLTKRLTVPFGYGKWTAIEEWYERAVFRSHVREPDADDLAYIARDLKLRDWRVFGRNWTLYILAGKTALSRAAANALDLLIRWRASLCGELYLVGTPPESLN
jgi:SAM-dependent methyltransferase